jgi:hypothetical protein
MVKLYLVIVHSCFLSHHIWYILYAMQSQVSLSYLKAMNLKLLSYAFRKHEGMLLKGFSASMWSSMKASYDLSTFVY